MEVKINFTKSAQKNASDYYTKAKKLAQKKQGVKETISKLENKLAKMKAELLKEEKEKIKKTKIKQKKEWYEKFHWFFTSNGMLVIGGRDAKQNEILNSKYFQEGDLFFHADIFGAAVVILKNGVNASKEVKREAAQFAACYSSAWKEGLSNIDVYAMRRDQVSKSTSKGSLGTGSFFLKGEREWYKSTELKLVAINESGKLKMLPGRTAEKFLKLNPKARFVEIKIGSEKKSDAAKRISHILNIDSIDDIIQQLPSGGVDLYYT